MVLSISIYITQEILGHLTLPQKVSIFNINPMEWSDTNRVYKSVGKSVTAEKTHFSN